MTVYVIARKNEDFLDSPVFHAGEDNQQEAIAVFTSEANARTYIDDAGWGDEFRVSELRPIQMLRWFAMAHEDGCDLAAIDPSHNPGTDGGLQQTVDLREPLAAFAETLQTKLENLDEVET